MKVSFILVIIPMHDVLLHGIQVLYHRKVFLRTLYCIEIVCKSALQLRIPVVTINYSPGFLSPASLSRQRGGKRSGPGGNYWRSMLPTAQNSGLLGVHFQSPWRNFGMGSMQNAPWVPRDSLHTYQEMIFFLHSCHSLF